MIFFCYSELVLKLLWLHPCISPKLFEELVQFLIFTQI